MDKHASREPDCLTSVDCDEDDVYKCIADDLQQQDTNSCVENVPNRVESRTSDNTACSVVSGGNVAVDANNCSEVNAQTLSSSSQLISDDEYRSASVSPASAEKDCEKEAHGVRDIDVSRSMSDQNNYSLERSVDTDSKVIQDVSVLDTSGSDRKEETAAVAAMVTAVSPDDAAAVDSIGEFCDNLSIDSSQQCNYDEPYLKYERMGADMALLLAEESASCLAVHQRVIAVGTTCGRVHVFDHLGNRVRESYFCHSLTVNQVCVDEAAEYIGSCSDDGTVAVSALCSPSSSTSHDDPGQFRVTLDTPVKSMALDPLYCRGGSRRRLVIGSTRVVLYERSFLSRIKNSVLFDGSSSGSSSRSATIEAMRWQNRLLAWASSNSEVRVYHVNSRRLISVILVDAGARPQNYRCHLFWTDDCRQLLIGWKNCAQIARLCDNRGVVKSATITSVDTSSWFMEIIHIFHTDFIVCGMSANSDGSRLFLLSQLEDCGDIAVRSSRSAVGSEASTGASVAYDRQVSVSKKRPQMRVIRPLVDDYEELSADELAVRGCQHCTCRQYHVESLADEGALLLLAPVDLLVARPRDTDDHLDWLLEQEQFEEALHQLRVCAAASVKRHNVQDVGRRYLDSLLQQEQYETAASMCHSIFGKNRTLWEEEVFRFASLRQLKVISPYLPRGDFRLHSTVYEMVLYSFLRTDSAEFLRLLKDWCPSLYHCSAIVNGALEQLLHEPDNPHLLEGLALLYTLQNRYDKALVVYMKLGHRCVFELVRKHQLHAHLANRVWALAGIDSNLAVELVTDRPDLISCDQVVSELTAHAPSSLDPPVVFKYLQRLYQRHSPMSAKYHDLLVQLYADHQPSQLFSFLRSSGSYSLQHALSVCRSRCRIPETVYLLGRMGSTREALKLIMLELADINGAIEFCKEHSDVDLWDQLITLCLDQPSMIKQLLMNIGTHVDPQRLLRRLPSGVVIPGLRDALVQMLHDYKIQLVMQKHCRNTIVVDYFKKHRQMSLVASAGVLVEPMSSGGRECAVCGDCVLSNCRGDIVVFYCSHACHQHCLAISSVLTSASKSPMQVRCPVCENGKNDSY